MADKPDSDAKQKAVGGDLVIPVLAVVFTIYYFISIIDSPWTAQVGAVFVGSILILLCALFLAQTFWSLRAGRAALDWGKLVAPVSFIPRRLALLGLTVLYIALLPFGGFTLTGFAYLYAAMLLLGGSAVRWTAFWLALAFSLTGYLLFVVAFQIRFPRGPFEELMRSMF